MELYERVRTRPDLLDEAPTRLMLIDRDARSFDPYNTADDHRRRERGVVEFVRDGARWLGDRR